MLDSEEAEGWVSAEDTVDELTDAPHDAEGEDEETEEREDGAHVPVCDGEMELGAAGGLETVEELCVFELDHRECECIGPAEGT